MKQKVKKNKFPLKKYSAKQNKDLKKSVVMFLYHLQHSYISSSYSSVAISIIHSVNYIFFIQQRVARGSEPTPADIYFQSITR